jgi:hypothetical protein
VWVDVIWDLEDDPDGNIQHIAEHGVAPPEVEEILRRPVREEISRSSGRPLRVGWTSTGRLLAVIYEVIEDDPFVVYPVTAFDVTQDEDDAQ